MVDEGLSWGVLAELVEPVSVTGCVEDAEGALGAGASIAVAGCAGELSHGALEPADPPERVLGAVEVP